MTLTEESKRPTTPAGPQPQVRSVFSFRNRGLLGGLLLVPVATAVIFSRPVLAEDGFPALLLNAGGWIFFLIYAGVRVWATLFIGGHKDRELQTDGPYSLCRNPLYFGSFCYALSTACFLKSATFGAAVLLLSVVYSRLVVRAEEHALGLRFGEDFKNYCRRTSRFWPRWSAFHTPPNVRVDLKWVRKESIRLARAALCILLLQTLIHLRNAPWWPNWPGLW